RAANTAPARCSQLKPIKTMSRPRRKGAIPDDPFKHRVTLFFTEGQSVGILVTNHRGRRQAQAISMATAEAALAYCRAHAAALLYLPNPNRN
ncbi:MAG: hypothetical protein KIT22_19800, partial [Verrucomicrobiae bacterium]|nr:hypothetical protein [Verrucomicrobiae bacterium]